jgi:WD40 repeat protein/serine/threonine protein kinase
MRTGALKERPPKAHFSWAQWAALSDGDPTMAGAPLSSHPSTELLRLFGSGALRGGEADAVEAHVETCPECCRALELFTDNDFVRRVGTADRDRLAAPRTDPLFAAVTPPDPAAVEDSALAPLRDHPHYRVLRELGRGGMSVVYLARQAAPDRLVALKVLLGGAHADPERRARLRAEANAIARLNHPNIVTVYEVGEHAGLPYLALEYVPGGALGEYTRGTPQPPGDAACLVETLGRAMHAAHKAGVVHRDLKPANVLLQEEEATTNHTNTTNQERQEENKEGKQHGPGPDNALSSIRGIRVIRGCLRPKVTDFGLAKQANAELTATGAVLGTPSYMAPEQAAGDSATVGPAADVYALGAILYELLTGRPPFRGVSVLETLEQVRHQEPVSPRLLQPGVPRDLETVCLKCLDKDPAKRYTSAETLAEDLRRFGAGEPVRARPVGALGRLHKWARRRPAVAALLGLVVTVSAIGLGGILWAYGQARQAEKTARNEAENARVEKQRADGEAAVARQQEKEARWQAHLARLGRVNGQLLARDHAGALQTLDQLSPDERGWEYGYLRRQAEGTPLVLRGHASNIYSVCYNPDGTRLASASKDGTVKVWDATSGAPIATLRGHTHWVFSVCYSPDGTRLASASQDSTVKVWDARSGAFLATLRGHNGGVTAVAYSPDGTRLASAADDKTVKLWDARTGTDTRTLHGHTARVNSVAYSLDGTRLASASWDQTVKVWDAHSGAELASLRGHTNWVNSVAYSPDGTRLASASYDKTVKLWDARSGAEIATLRGHTYVVNAVAYSPDGTRLASAAHDKTVRVWDARSGAPIATLGGHAGPVYSVVYSPDGTRTASASLDNTVKVWDARSGADIATLRGHTKEAWSVAYAPDGRHLASAAADQTVKVWDAHSGAVLATLRGHTDQVTSVVYSPDGTQLASASYDGTIKLWDARSGAALATLRGHTNWVKSVAYSPDGTRLASASYDNMVKVWDARRGAEIATLRGHTSGVTAVVYSPDGSRLASASDDRTVKLWDADSGTELATLRGHTGDVRSLSYSPDGSRLASASADKTIKVWDAHSGAEVATLVGHAGYVQSVVYSPDGVRLASASVDETVKIWDARSGAELTTLVGHAGFVSSLCYSPDGTRLASASGDHTVKVWDARTAAEVATLRGHAGDVRWVSYNPDGTRLASASADQTIKVWDAKSGTEALTLRGHMGDVLCVSYSPDGSRLASASEDNTVKLWDARSGAELVTLAGHTGYLLSVGYSPDGGRLVSMESSGKTLVWDAASGKPVPEGRPPRLLPTNNVSPDGHFVAVPHGTGIRIYRRRPGPGSYDPWAEDAERRRVQAPPWHAAQAEAARQRGDTFAAVFHQRRLAERDNLRLLAWARRAAGDNDGARQALRQLRDEQRGVAVAWQLSGALASALPARPTPGASAGTLAAAELARWEERRGAAQLVRAAALWPDSRIDAAELVALARSCVQSDPQSWQYHELLGAAFYRDGKPGAAVGELDEAVRRRGADGSLWSRLFLALAHRRLGHAEQAAQWRKKAGQADTWEEAVVQQLLGELDGTMRPARP